MDLEGQQRHRPVARSRPRRHGVGDGDPPRRARAHSDWIRTKAATRLLAARPPRRRMQVSTGRATPVSQVANSETCGSAGPLRPIQRPGTGNCASHWKLRLETTCRFGNWPERQHAPAVAAHDSFECGSYFRMAHSWRNAACLKRQPGECRPNTAPPGRRLSRHAVVLFDGKTGTMWAFARRTSGGWRSSTRTATSPRPT
jgi:hypothetical protein